MTKKPDKKNGKPVKFPFLKISMMFAFWTALSYTSIFLTFNARIMDHPVKQQMFSNYEVILGYLYATFYYFVIFTAFSYLLFRIFRLISPQRQISDYKSPAWINLLWSVVIVAISLMSIFNKSLLAYLPMVPLYYVMSIIAYLIYLSLNRRSKLLKFLIYTITAFVFILGHSLLLPVAQLYTSKVLLIEFYVVFVFIYFRYIMKHLYIALEYNLGLGKIPLNQSIFIRILKGLTVIYIFALIIGCLWGYWSENRDTELAYYPIDSTTDKDVNIIFITIDALRADHLSSYGYSRQTSPNIDIFANENTRYEYCYVPATWTKPSTASFLTSLYPKMHGALHHGEILPDEVTTLAEIMQENGFVTYGYVANPNLKTIFNFQQGFDYYDDYVMRDKMYLAQLRNLPFFTTILPKVTGKHFSFVDRDNIILANQFIFPWLDKIKDQNFFAYLHYMDPHAPYAPPNEYRTLFPYEKNNENQKILSLYDGEIRLVDDHIQKLFQKLKDLNIYDKTMIVITSDHGEAFKEHYEDTSHGHTIYQELVKVPLIIKFPGNNFQRIKIEKQVTTLDILPTILDWLNIPTDLNLQGLSLIPLLEDNTLDLHEYIYIDEDFDDIFILQGIIKNNKWKYIFTEKTTFNIPGPEELFDLQADPGELNNIIEQHPDILRELQEKAAQYYRYNEKHRLIAPTRKIDQETMEQLKALGYL